MLFISLLIYRRLRSLPVARDISRNSSAPVGEERRGTAEFAGNIFRLDYQPLFGKCARASLPYRLLQSAQHFKTIFKSFFGSLILSIRPLKKANRKNAKKRTLRELASIIANLHNLSSSVKIKQKLR